MSSDNHTDALMKVLSGVSMPSNTTSEAVTAIIGKMVEANIITFRRGELPVEDSRESSLDELFVETTAVPAGANEAARQQLGTQKLEAALWSLDAASIHGSRVGPRGDGIGQPALGSRDRDRELVRVLILVPKPSL